LTHREACLNVFVQIHASLQQMSMKLEKKGQKTVSITPRHYIDFINHFVRLYNEKRAELEEQQMHFNMGLAKIRETVNQVEELQKSLAIKRAELEKKNTEANLKLKQMLNDQQEAQNKKAASEDLKIILKVLIQIIVLFFKFD
jgi:dynein heavy chain 1